MIILSVDTSTESASCAVLDDEKLLGETSFNYKKQHSVILMDMIEDLLSKLHIDISEIDGFVVSKGPGSFTGLRIGMAAVKGLAFGCNKPLVSISTLDSLAFNMAFSEGIICPIMDALRNNVYTGLYNFNGEVLNKITDNIVVSIDELAAMLSSEGKAVYFVGDGIYKFKDFFKEKLSNCYFAPTHLNIAKAASLGELGLKLLEAGVSEDLNTCTPIYLRKSQAEREYDKKMRLLENGHC